MLNGQRVGSVFDWSDEFSGRTLSENNELVIYEMSAKSMSTPPAIRASAGPSRVEDRRMEVWSVTAWSTVFDRAYGESTSSGSRGPYPQRSW
jgi:hypothetical protein